MTDKKKSDAGKGLSFEEALSQLEAIVKSLEDPDMKLEDAITAYEKGARLKEQCEKQLKKAELKVQAIIQKSDGTLDVKNME